jgi:hypothetical protein
MPAAVSVQSRGDVRLSLGPMPVSLVARSFEPR